MTEPNEEQSLTCPEMTVTIESSDSELSPNELDGEQIISDLENGDNIPLDGQRRPSRWSATILFVASEIQLIFDLAQLCQPEGTETAPRKPKPETDPPNSDGKSLNGSMEAVELQPQRNGNVPVGNNIGPNSNGKDPPYGDIPDGHLLLPAKEIPDEIKIPEKIEIPNHELECPPRETWGKKADFLLAVIGYSVDLANVWRFPYLAYKNGGGAFIIPYFTVLFLGAIPVFFMELSMGQFNKEGPIKVWKIVPICRGIGYASCLMAYIVAFYYNIVIGWAFYYLFNSFTSDLPWASCNNSFNSPNCWELDWSTNTTNSTYNSNTSVSSSYEFFERGMLGLHMSRGVDDLGKVKWQLAMCTLLTFTMLYFCLWKNIKSAGKVVWFTATIPYLILTILLVRGCLLPGSAEGVSYFITPNVSRLGDPQVWIDAAIQIFFSIGAGFGTHIAYASYNQFNNNCYRDCLITAGVNSFTSIYSGFVVFTYLGYMAAMQHKHINEVAQEGPGLVFIVYPEAIATLPGSFIWAILFFFMLVTLGLDSAFGGLESPLTGLGDIFQEKFRLRWSREVLTFIIIVTAFLFSIPCVTVGGMYVFKILDAFAAGTSIVFTVLCQVIAVAWIYGVEQFCSDIKEMTGRKPGLYWKVCWKFLCPTFLLIIVISSFLHYQPLVYKGGVGTYVYPPYANIVGWLIAFSSMSMIPIYAVYKLLATRGSFKQRVALGITPTREHESIMNKTEVKRFKIFDSITWIGRGTHRGTHQGMEWTSRGAMRKGHTPFKPERNTK